MGEIMERDDKGRFVKDHKGWNKDRHLTVEHRKKIGEANKGRGKIVIPKEELQKLYLEEKFSTIKIGKLYGVDFSTILARMDEYGIQRRSRSEALNGRVISQETKKKMSTAQEGKHRSPSTQFKKGHPLYYIPPIEQTRKMCEANRKFFTSKKELFQLYHKEKLSVIQIAAILDLTPTTIVDWLKRYDIPIRSNAESTKLSWKRSEYVKKQMRGRGVRPNKPEKKLIKIIGINNLPFRYVGDGEVIIGRLCPDFIHSSGEKKVVELFGRTFHDPSVSFRKVIPWHQQYWGRTAYYGQLGYDCLILWDDELKNTERVVGRIEEFLK